MSRIIRTTPATGQSLPEAGKIKIGETVHATTAQGKEYDRPVSLDYFRATGTYAEMFKKQFGEKPKKLLIVFVSDDIDEVCNQRFESWDKGKRWGWGNGEDFTVYSEQKKDYVNVKKGDPLLSGKKWDEFLTLRFILPELKGVMAMWSFTTKGAKSTIPSLIKTFDFVKANAGTVRGVPFEFHVEKVKGYSPGEARQYSRTKIVPVLTIETAQMLHDYVASGLSISDVAPIMLNEAKLGGNVKMLEAPAVELKEEDVVTHAEVVEKPKVQTISIKPGEGLFGEDAK